MEALLCERYQDAGVARPDRVRAGRGGVVAWPRLALARRCAGLVGRRALRDAVDHADQQRVDGNVDGRGRTPKQRVDQAMGATAPRPYAAGPGGDGVVRLGVDRLGYRALWRCTLFWPTVAARRRLKQ